MRNGGEESLQPVDSESTVCQQSTANESRLLSLSASHSHSHSHTKLVLLSRQGVNVSWTDPKQSVYVKEEGRRRRQDKEGVSANRNPMAASNKQATIPRCDAPWSRNTTSSCKLTATGNQDRPGLVKVGSQDRDENGGQKKGG